MATGDAAAAKGLPVVPASKDLRLGYDDINAIADALANEMDARAAGDGTKMDSTRLRVTATKMTAATASTGDVRVW